MVVAGARLLRRKEVTGSQTPGPGHAPEAGPHASLCAGGWTTWPLTQRARTRPRFRQAEFGLRPSGLVSGSLCGSHLPGQSPLSNRGFKPRIRCLAASGSIWASTKRFLLGRRGSAEGGSVEGRQRRGPASSPPARPTPLKSVHCGGFTRHPAPAPRSPQDRCAALGRRASRGNALPQGVEAARRVASQGRTLCTFSREWVCGLMLPGSQNFPSVSPSLPSLFATSH